MFAAHQRSTRLRVAQVGRRADRHGGDLRVCIQHLIERNIRQSGIGVCGGDETAVMSRGDCRKMLVAGNFTNAHQDDSSVKYTVALA